MGCSLSLAIGARMRLRETRGLDGKFTTAFVA
jgi:hypothetical protein